jgi:glyceraldehyde 3-phosphate dehydrogenase
VGWSDTDCVIDSSGVEGNALSYRDIKGDAPSHVIVTHTFAEADFTLVFGVNEELFDPSQHRIISSSICDAGAIAPVLKQISDRYGLNQCFITTLHPWLPYQNITDGPICSEAYPKLWHGYYPLGRASVGALIPKPTTVGQVLESLIPVMKGRISSMSYRAPTSVVASADISIVTSSSVNTQHLRALLISLNGSLVRCSNEMLVSVDYKGETASAIIDLRWLEVLNEHYVKLVLWYDNEWGYSARVIDILDLLSK